jgi:hypothetical protein
VRQLGEASVRVLGDLRAAEIASVMNVVRMVVVPAVPPSERG